MKVVTLYIFKGFDFHSFIFSLTLYSGCYIFVLELMVFHTGKSFIIWTFAYIPA